MPRYALSNTRGSFSTAILGVALLICSALLDGCRSSQDGLEYRTWVATRIAQLEAGPNARQWAVAIALRQHACGNDRTCLPEVAWRRLDARAQAARDPAILALLANVASAIPSDSADQLARWERIATLDAGNAYPLVVQASIHWKRGERDMMLAQLDAARALERYDDYFTALFAAVKEVVEARPPTHAEMAPCSLVGTRPNPGAPQLLNAAIFDIVGDVGFFSRLGDFVGMCRRDGDPPYQKAAPACDAVGVLVERQSTSLLSRNSGLGMRRAATGDVTEAAALEKRQQDNLDALYRSLWWVDSPDSRIRDEADTFWLEQFARKGELVAADKLIERFGQPPDETREARFARFREQLAAGQACYAKVRKGRP